MWGLCSMLDTTWYAGTSRPYGLPYIVCSIRQRKQQVLVQIIISSTILCFNKHRAVYWALRFQRFLAGRSRATAAYYRAHITAFSYCNLGPCSPFSGRAFACNRAQ